MGHGLWSPATYRSAAASRGGADAFAYSARAHQTGVLRAHQTLDPHGLRLRESRDSADHPDSNAIIISLDVTGSMGAVVRGIHADLPRLHELLLGHHYIASPQICFAAVGDATCDRVPLQIGQFESDNRMDQNLENMILEGGGGGQKTESYELMLYLAARHTAIDCWEKRRRKGYLFIIGDELAYPTVKRDEVFRLIGIDIERDIPTGVIAGEVRQRYHTYYILPGGASYGHDPEVLGFWREMLGADRVIELEDPSDTSHFIGMAIGMNEGKTDLESGVGHLQQRGVVGRTIERVTTALANLVPGTHVDTPDDRARRL